jgi:hypothetical protein
MPNQKGKNPRCKKVGKKGRKSHSSAAKSSQENPQSSFSFPRKLVGPLPTFHDPRNEASKNNASSTAANGYYNICKEASLTFHSWISRDACPQYKLRVVGDYRNAVQEIMHHNYGAFLKQHSNDLIVAPPAIMISLATSLQVREQIAEKHLGLEDSFDTKQRYIINVLQYCQNALQFANRIATLVKKEREEAGGVVDKISGWLTNLTLIDKEDRNWSDIDRDIKDGKFPLYSGVEVEQELCIYHVVLNGDDRFQATALLLTLDDLMGTIHDHYALLKAFMRGKHPKQQETSCIQLVLECAAVANVATKSVQRVEEELAKNHPHLSTFYHVLALLFLENDYDKFNKIMDKKKSKKDPHMTLNFIARIVERSFQEGFGLDKPICEAKKHFAEQSGLPHQLVKDVSPDFEMECLFETLRDFELNAGTVANPSLSAEYAAMGLKPNTWMSKYKHIGGDFSILNTQKFAQMSLNAMATRNSPLVQLGFSGLPFDENTNPATGIRGDLDERFMHLIFPVIILLCNNEPLDYLPHRSSLMTVFDLVREHLIEDSTKAVPIALSFGLHAVLMSIFVLQGDGDLATVAVQTKQSYDKLFAQLQGVADRSTLSKNAPRMAELIELYGSLGGLPYQMDNAPGEIQSQDEMLAFWNPLVGGEYMLCSTYLCSIEFGTATFNSLCQLKFVLHLYNALRLRDPSLIIPLLRGLDTIFMNSKSVWVGLEPDLGSCCNVFYMALGIDATSAARLASERGTYEDFFRVFSSSQGIRG